MLNRYSSVHQKEFYAVQYFLSACNDGPLIALLNRLTDVFPLYEYPATQLPTNRQGQGNSTNIFLNAFEFYFYHFFNLPLRRQTLYQGVNQGSVTDSVYPILVEDYLNSFLPTDPSNQSKLFAQCRTTPGSFHHQIQEIQQQQTIKSNFETIQAHNTSPTNFRSTLLRKDFSISPLQSQQGQEISTVRTSFASPAIQGIAQPVSPLGHNKGTKGTSSETWRSETFSRILMAFWIESYVNYDLEENYPRPGHLTSTSTFTTPLPSSELLRCIRMFIKHAHYFSNACKEGGPYIPSSLTFSPGGADLFSSYGGIGGSSLEGSNGGNSSGNNKTLFAFLSLCIDHWPLDASFRLVLETWLSYIQPWRYTQLNNSKSDTNKNASESNDAVDTAKWSAFVEENIKFYTNMLYKLLSTRFSRLDLSSHKNAYMLFRITKVYSQENVMSIIGQASTTQCQSIFQNMNHASPSRNHPTMNVKTMAEASGVGICSKENLTTVSAIKGNWTGISFNSVHLLGPEFKELISTILLALYEAKRSEMRTRKIAETLNKSHHEKERSIAFPSRLVALVADLFGLRNNSRPSTPGPSGMDPTEKAESDKTLQYLDFCMEKLSLMFDLKNALENMLQNPGLNSGCDDIDSPKDSDDNNTHEYMAFSGLSPAQRRDILLKKVKVHNKYDGHPDKLPIRSDEFRFMVRILLYISNQINKKWRSNIERWYNRRPGFAYAVFRQLCTAPCIYRSSGYEILDESELQTTETLADNMNKSYCGSLQRYDASRKRQLPARIVLRPLAGYKLIFYLALSYIIFIFFCQKSFISSTVIMLFLYTIWIVAKAMVDCISGEDEKRCTENNSAKPIDLTLDATTLCQDHSY